MGSNPCPLNPTHTTIFDAPIGLRTHLKGVHTMDAFAIDEIMLKFTKESSKTDTKPLSKASQRAADWMPSGCPLNSDHTTIFETETRLKDHLRKQHDIPHKSQESKRLIAHIKEGFDQRRAHNDTPETGTTTSTPWLRSIDSEHKHPFPMRNHLYDHLRHQHDTTREERERWLDGMKAQVARQDIELDSEGRPKLVCPVFANHTRVYPRLSGVKRHLQLSHKLKHEDVELYLKPFRHNSINNMWDRD